MKIAFLGMGIMGAPMALNCLKAGHEVTVWNRTRAKCKPLEEAGSLVAETPAEAVAGKEAILICVEDHDVVEKVLFGKDGAAEGLKEAHGNVLVIDHSTISPKAEAEFAAKLKTETKAQLLDGPVTGGDAGAKAGTLSIMVGGPKSAFEQAKPLLGAMGKTITHIGENVGDGQRAKLINQVLVLINLMAMTESMRLGELVKMNMQAVLTAVGGGAAGSWSLNNLGPKWLARDFAPGFRLKHLLKDIRYAKEMVEEGDDDFTKFPGLHLGLELLEKADAAGYGDQATQALGRLFESPSKS